MMRVSVDGPPSVDVISCSDLWSLHPVWEKTHLSLLSLSKSRLPLFQDLWAYHNHLDNNGNKSWSPATRWIRLIDILAHICSYSTPYGRAGLGNWRVWIPIKWEWRYRTTVFFSSCLRATAISGSNNIGDGRKERSWQGNRGTIGIICLVTPFIRCGNSFFTLYLLWWISILSYLRKENEDIQSTIFQKKKN